MPLHACMGSRRTMQCTTIFGAASQTERNAAAAIRRCRSWARGRGRGQDSESGSTEAWWEGSDGKEFFFISPSLHGDADGTTADQVVVVMRMPRHTLHLFTSHLSVPCLGHCRPCLLQTPSLPPSSRGGEAGRELSRGGQGSCFLVTIRDQSR